jgi:uncharacterized surface protein with fasciclin (FAS1) repeats
MQYVALLLVALAASASAFAPAGFAPRRHHLTVQEASVQETLETATGPNLYWGSNTQDMPENEIKGTTDYKLFAASAKAAGVDLSSGEFTVIAPTDLAFEEANVDSLTKEQVELHMVPGKVSLDGLKKDTTTVNGKVLTYKRFARQDYLDDAIIGQGPQGPATGQTHSSFECDNGWVHSVAFVLQLDYESSIMKGTTTVV